MHTVKKLNKAICKIEFAFVCILLLSSVLSFVYATNAEGNVVGYVEFGSCQSADGDRDIFPQIRVDGNDMTAKYENIYDLADIRIEVKETAIYTITVNSLENKEIPYWFGDANGGNARLAARYINGEYRIISSDTSSTNTTIDVLLETNKEYEFQIEGVESLEITIAKRPYLISACAYTNIPSYTISGNVAILGNNYTAYNLGTYNNPTIKGIELSQEFMENFLYGGGYEEEGKATQTTGDFLQGILVDIILTILRGLTDIVESLVGSDVPLTMDNIIFNRFEQTIIDFTSLGGIKFESNPLSGKGVFNTEGLGQAITVLFNGLKGLAIVIYIVMLLYIGVKTLLSVGTKDQRKSLRFFEYWVTGLFFLILIPYLLPAIPVIGNAFVNLIGEEAGAFPGSFSVEEVLERLGADRSLLGEDADTVTAQRLLSEKIEELNGQIANIENSQSREEAQNNIDYLVDLFIQNYGHLIEDQQELQNKINVVVEFIDDNYMNWGDTEERRFNALVDDVMEFVFDNSYTQDIITANDFSVNIQGIPEMRSILNEIIMHIKSNAYKWNEDESNERKYNLYKDNLYYFLEYRGKLDVYDLCETKIDTMKNELINFASQNSDFFESFEELFSTYKDAVIREEIKVLQEMKDSLTNDVMELLAQRAQKEHSLVYAIAYAIIWYQMFAVLFMYYKRIISIAVLIIIFPLVMAFYIFDKLDDGKSQALSKWFKEFIANIAVQVLHAAIYTVVIGIGVDIYMQNPSSNWFILIVTTSFLFPAERMLRGMLNLNASTLGELKVNGQAAILGATAIAKTGFDIGRGVKRGIKDVKTGNTIDKKIETAMEKERNSTREKKRKKRRNNAQRVRTERQQRITQGNATRFDYLRENIDTKKDKIKQTVGNTRVIRGVRKAGSVVNKVRKSDAYVLGKMTLKKAGSLARRGAGLTMGAVEGMESFGKEGVMSGIYTAKSTATKIGGFKRNTEKVGKINSNNSSSTPSQRYAASGSLPNRNRAVNATISGSRTNNGSSNNNYGGTWRNSRQARNVRMNSRRNQRRSGLRNQRGNTRINININTPTPPRNNP